MLAFSQSADNNKIDICDKLADILNTATSLLEIGSGTGQHAVYMAERLAHIKWHTSEMAENLASLKARLDAEAPKNVTSAIELDVSSHPWPLNPVDAIYSANTVHIMSWAHVEHFLRGASDTLKPGGHLCLYGPYKYNGDFTTPSNEKFDQWLKGNNPLSGIRDFEAVHKLAQENGLKLLEDISMPANNQLLVWQI